MSRLASLGITLIGAGAIGSTTAVFLGKMGACGIQVWDADTVEPHNWSNQLYRDEDIGKQKVTALTEVMEHFGGHTPNAIAQRYVDQELSEVVISAVDSMSSRSAIWRSVREKAEVKLCLDARMGLETLIVWAVRPQVREDRVAYSQSIVADDAALQEPCTARTVCYTPLMAAAVLCNLVKRYVNDEQIPQRVVLDLATLTLMT
ncbi:MAG TPA: ThiF family adenylyltransferase [bacterium]